MINRDQVFITLRPNLSLLKKEGQSEQESFQNDVLRPILKLQHDVIIALFRQLLLDRKFDLNIDSINIDRLQQALDKIAFGDKGFKDRLVGIVIGMMTKDELSTFFVHQSEYRRRILAMAKQRIESVY